jgi:hypothetical protein
MRSFPLIFLAALLVPLAACNPPITAEKVDKIRLCETTFDETKEMFGKASKISRIGDLYVHDFSNTLAAGSDGRHRLLLAFNGSDVVVDVLYDTPAGTVVSLSDHCKGKPAGAAPAPAPVSSSSAAANAPSD